MLYAVTSGGNPTGVNWSLDRKKAVYHVARAHDLIIIEDDAYYFLQFNRVSIVCHVLYCVMFYVSGVYRLKFTSLILSHINDADSR